MELRSVGLKVRKDGYGVLMVQQRERERERDAVYELVLFVASLGRPCGNQYIYIYIYI